MAQTAEVVGSIFGAVFEFVRIVLGALLEQQFVSRLDLARSQLGPGVQEIALHDSGLKNRNWSRHTLQWRPEWPEKGRRGVPFHPKGSHTCRPVSGLVWTE